MTTKTTKTAAKAKPKPKESEKKDAPAGFDLSQNLRFQRRSWIVQRVGRALMALAVLAALLGLLGPGPLSKASAGEEERLEVEYDRFLRQQGENRLTVKLGPGSAPGEEARVWLDARYMQDNELQAVVPEPERVEATEERVVLVFALARPGAGLEAVVDLQPRAIGPVRGAIGVAGGPTARIAQFVYP